MPYDDQDNIFVEMIMARSNYSQNTINVGSSEFIPRVRSQMYGEDTCVGWSYHEGPSRRPRHPQELALSGSVTVYQSLYLGEKILYKLSSYYDNYYD